ncbi:MAG: exo-alpha-sialidase [Oligosphaeraceae bacterium]|nr:exo-alpha-sialidase [Oligosphaeraceae bacterium]
MEVIRNVVICSRPYDHFGFFGWPSIARQTNGTLVAVTSGLRTEHVCPWGKTVLFRSYDNGLTWTDPEVLNNTPLDDRDAGIISLGGQRLAVTWFTSNTYAYKVEFKDPATGLWDEKHRDMGVVLDTWTDELVNKYFGSWIRVSPDGNYWGETLRAPVGSPHGFIVLKDGRWLYFGKKWPLTQAGLKTRLNHGVPVIAAISADEGKNWEILGEVPNTSNPKDYACEAHVIELDNGELLGAVRIDNPYRTLVTRSKDGGRSWTEMADIGINTAPPHLIRHSSGAIILTYGYRVDPLGERARISFDGGQTFEKEIILRDDAPYGDLGYAASVEMSDGNIFTIYYQVMESENEQCSLQGTIWKL